MNKVLISTFVLFLTSIPLLKAEFERESECSQCQPDKCPKVSKCNAGIVKDKCGCCLVCALEEGHLCNTKRYSPTAPWYGTCGNDLECRVRTDIDRAKVGNQSVCFCIKSGVQCGSDDRTYSECQMKAKELETDNRVKRISHGHCKTGPKIITIGKSQAVKKGSSISVLCEVEGFPMPSVKWYHTPPSSEKNIELPGDSDDISISFRGGPQAMRLTSHLQITNFDFDNEGKYGCYADNDMGMTKELVSLVVAT